jgi:hypothetical protein
MVTDEEKEILKKEILKEHYRSIGSKAVKTLKERYGNEHYKKMITARWDKYRKEKAEKAEQE